MSAALTTQPPSDRNFYCSVAELFFRQSDLIFHFALFEAILFCQKGSKPEKKLSKWAAKINFALDLPCRAIIGPILLYDFAWNVDYWGSQMTLYHPWLSEAAIRRSKFSGFFQWLFWVPMMVNKASMVKFWMCSAKNPSTGCQPVCTFEVHLLFDTCM